MHHLGVGADHKEHGLGVQGVGQKARAQSHQHPELTGAGTVQGNPCGVGQRLVAKINQVPRPQHFHCQKQRRTLADDHRNAQHGVQHMHLHPQGNAQGRSQARTPAEGVTAAGHHGKVGARADHR
ncbi:hypothetical protein D3C77_628830 [compost metagenome]